MPSGDKSKYTDKQKRQAEHIEESYEKQGMSEDEAESRAWATVNKQDGGGKQSGSGRKKPDSDKNAEDAPDRDSSATKGAAGTRPPSDS
jgi:plasmid stabilization system protein ParE